MLETEQQYTNVERGASIDNPLKIGENWEAYYFDRANDGGTSFAIRDEDFSYSFGAGAGMPIEQITPEDCELVSEHLNEFACNSVIQSFSSILANAKEALVVEIPYLRYLAILDYLRDRAIVDPRAKQLLEELEA